MMTVRRAEEKDIPVLKTLLMEVLNIHAQGRPDIFVPNTTKYTDEELVKMISDPRTPIFVYDEDGTVLGYAFCIYKERAHSNNMTDIRTLFIDDLCVDAAARGKHVGESLYHYVKDYARANGFYHVTLNVWSFNEKAIGFYEAMGLKPMEYVMEEVLK
ncbi:MAG: GNAT family N-acetyltransferase [Galactobacillus timonensis]|uniref:GNAT family N-acetyltransferase n=2 Tax=Galactobacillus timonensis TaxID=2041840 RepID=UPI00240995C9|nr:GNAT family N-acetyltransferase [Galactobacillus timonensis]MDD6599142.1 GNAT family N-acetyltransferase [Galactobacillus timonensis]